MKKILIILFLFIIPFITFSQNKFIVVIDPGHGGHDSGAVGYSGILEKDITLAISIKLKKELKDQGITAVLTRSSDKFLSLTPRDQRSIISNQMNADLFISIHLNAGTFSGSGAECYISKFKGADANKKNAVILSELILGKLKTDLGFKNRGTQFGDFSVLRNTIEQCPSILLELGFISNKPEMEFMLGNGANLIAKNIAKAVKDYKEIVKQK